jgi:hypothetical protein
MEYTYGANSSSSHEGAGSCSGREVLRTASRVLAVLLFLASPLAAADDEDIALRKYHPWGRFHVGSWNHVRIVTQTVDDGGRVISTSTTDTKSTLVERRLESFALRLETSVEVAGKKIPSQPQVVKLGYAGENLGEQLSYRNVEGDSVSIDGRKIDCSVQEVEIIGVGQKLVSLVRYADSVAPFVLHRKTTRTDLVRPAQPQETELEVIALEMPFKVCDVLQSTAHTKQVQRGPRGTTVTLSVVSSEVPGELVSQNSKKVDQKGRLTHRSSLELVAYYLAPDPTPEDEEGGDLRVPRRYHKRPRHDRR